MAVEKISPFDNLNIVLRRWWVIALLAIVGGVCGAGAGLMRPDIYEAKAELLVNADFTILGEIPEREVERLQSNIGRLVFSRFMRQQVAGNLFQAGLEITPEKLEEIAVLERRFAAWRLYIRHPDPETAATIANIWITTAFEELSQARAHARTASALQQYLDALDRCFEPDFSDALCALPTSIDVSAEIEMLSAMAEEEAQKSRGIIPGNTFEITELATPPQQPVTAGQNTFVLSGALLGFLFGIWIVNMRQPKYAHG